MQSQVIVPLDGSASAEAILPHALLFAQRGQSILTLLQIVTPSGLPEVRDRMIPSRQKCTGPAAGHLHLISVPSSGS